MLEGSNCAHMLAHIHKRTAASEFIVISYGGGLVKEGLYAHSVIS